MKFDNFQPNPLYESVVEGVDLFRREKLDSIIAIGGGSAIDVAKCIKLYSNMEGGGSDGSYLRQKIESNNVRLFVVPTTAGTGSEATRYAVIYYKGEKQTITHESMIPGTVLFDPSVLKTLSLYQKKVTMADAFCHGIESFWSVNSTDESRKYSKKAIKIIKYPKGEGNFQLIEFIRDDIRQPLIKYFEKTIYSSGTWGKPNI